MSRQATCRIGWAVLAGVGMWTAAFGRAQDAKPPKDRQVPSQPAAEDAKDVKPAPVPAPEDIIKELEKDKPEAPLLMPKEASGNVQSVRREAPSVTPNQKGQPNWPDGYILVDRVGRLVKDGQWWTLAFRSDENRTVRERPIRLLPSRMLESMEVAAARGSRNVLFRVSGEVTEFHSINYLLLRKVLIVRDHGNLE